MQTFSQINAGTGELETYVDTFGGVTPELVERAEELEREIVQRSGNLQKAYLDLAVALDEFDRDKLYLARGYDSFRLWAKSPEIGIDYRTAHDLIRIVREALPVLMNNNAMSYLQPISKMRMLLPTLADGHEMFLQAIKAIDGKTVQESYEIMDELRGIDPFKKQNREKKFRAVVRMGEKQHSVKLFAANPENMYTLGYLNIEREDWKFFEELFVGAVEFEIQDNGATTTFTRS